VINFYILVDNAQQFINREIDWTRTGLVAADPATIRMRERLDSIFNPGKNR
jgi:hypothetical protein